MRPPSCRTPGRAAASLTVHGWIYGLSDGRLSDAGFLAESPGDVVPSYLSAVDQITRASRLAGSTNGPLSLALFAAGLPPVRCQARDRRS